MSRSFVSPVSLASVIAVAVSGSASAAIYMDANADAAGFGSLHSQTWNTTNTNWTTDSTGLSTPGTWNNLNGVTTFDNSGGTGAATVTVGANFSVDGLALQGTQNVTFQDASTRTITVGSSGIDVASGRTLLINSSIRIAGSNVQKSGVGTLDFSNNNAARLTASSLTVSGGNVIFRNSGNLTDASGTAHRPTIVNNGTITLFNNITANLGSLSGSGTLASNAGGGGYTFDVTQSTDGTYSGGINANTSTGGVTHITSLVKRGDALLRLSGALVHDGGTTVEAGTLLINNTWTQTANGANAPGVAANLTVNGGTFGGTGAVTLATARSVVLGAGGKINPGDPAASDGVGTLTFNFGSTTGGFDATAGGTLEFQLKAPGTLAAPAVHDLLQFNNFAGGDVSFANTVVSPIDAGGLAEGYYTLMRFYSNAGTTFSSSQPTTGLTLSSAFLTAYPGSSLDYSQTGEIRLNVVPEPAALGSLAAGLLLLTPRRRRV